MALTSNVTGRMSGTLTSDFDGNTISAPFDFNANDSLATGTAINQADLAWWDSGRNLAATSEELDLAGGLTGPFGNSLTFVKIKGLYIKNNSTTVGETLKIGGAAANTFLLFDDATDIYELGPDGIFQIWEPSAAALPVTASTGDLLKIDSGAATLTYDIVIIGTSA